MAGQTAAAGDGMSDRLTIIKSDCLSGMAGIEAGSVQCCVTSPPYWGLRDYGIPATDWTAVEFVPMAGLPSVSVPAVRCVHGLEADMLSYVAHEVEIFRAVRRVLREDGTLWLNLGDSYARNGGEPGGGNRELLHLEGKQNRMLSIPEGSGLKPKDLVGIPWRVAFALQADGWYLRSDIIWHKPNPMPESVTDRPTKAHEYIFLLSKSPTYFYDAEAIKEQTTESTAERAAYGWNGKMVFDANGKERRSQPDPVDKMGDRWCPPSRNKRTVWTVSTAPFTGAHFATFPEDLIKPCILAGTSARGCCPKCGAPWERITARDEMPDSVLTGTSNPEDEFVRGNRRNGGKRHGSGQKMQDWLNTHPTKTIDWKPTCECSGDWSDHWEVIKDGEDKRRYFRRYDGGADSPVPCTVLDPFLGSGTTGQVALELGRKCIGIEINPEYVKLARTRCNVTPGLAIA
jgi:DNA modification methylase